LEKLRAMVRKACPEATESIKWNCPHFAYKGLQAGMAAIKHHASFGFWRAKEMSDPEGWFQDTRKSMCSLKYASVKDLPAERVFIAYIKEAMRLNEAGKPPAPKRHSKSELKVPASITNALKTSKKAKATWDA